MDLMEIRMDGAREGEGERLREVLAAQIALERATARRAFLAPVTLVACIPLAVSAAGGGSADFHRLALFLFAAISFAVIAAVIAEVRWRRALARACDGMGVRRSALWEPDADRLSAGRTPGLLGAEAVGEEER